MAGEGLIAPSRALSIGVLLTSFCMLLCELILTRIYSVVLGYHFAFLAISIALFGLGFSGILVYLRADWFPEERLFQQLSRFATWLGVSIYVALLLLLHLPADTEAFATLALIYLVSALPFFCGGMCLALAFTHRSNLITRLYYFDLLGAAAGCLVTIFLLNQLGGPNSLLLIGLVAVATGLVFGSAERTGVEAGRRMLVGLARFAMWVMGISVAGLAISPWVEPAVLAVGRNMYDRLSGHFEFPRSFEWYVDNFIADELSAAVQFVRIFLVAAGVLSVAAVLFARSARSREDGGPAASGFAHLFMPGFCGLLMLSLFALQLSQDELRVRYAKGRYEPPSLYEKWNSISRIKVLQQEGFGQSRILAWGLSEAYDGPDVEHLHMNIDSEAGMPLIRFDGDLGSAQAQHLKYDVSSIGFYLTPKPRSLIIGPGGGRDILTSLVFDSPRVIGVELNPIILDVVNNQFGDYTGRLYELPQVDLIQAEGRSYLRRTDDVYDIIQISLIDTWASVSRGALAISENSLYTQEAYDDYLAHLAPGGLVSITRWWHDPPDHLWRLLWMASDSLRAVGQDPTQNLLVIRGPIRGKFQGRVANVLATRSPLTEEQIQRIEQISTDLGFDIVYAPGREGFPNVTKFVLASPEERRAFAASLPIDVTPPTDDRPFFFSLTKAGDFFTLGARPMASQVLGRLFYLVLLLVLLFMFGPLFLLRRDELRALRGGALAWVVYFGCLGLGFIIVEMVLIQKFILFLGHPIYAVTLVLFGVLLASSLGSLTSGRFADDDLGRRLPVVLAGIVGLQAAAIAALPMVTSAFFDTALVVRGVVALLFVAPMGFAMGMPFPTGVRLLSRSYQSAVPWMWGVNGAASVLGTVIAAIFSIYFGFTTTYVLGASFYAVALGTFVLAALGRERESAPAAFPLQQALRDRVE